MPQFFSAEELTERIMSLYQAFKNNEAGNQIVLLVGSALTSSTSGKGVASVKDMIELICEQLPEPNRDMVRSLKSAEAYQTAFQLLQESQISEDAVNQIVRRGVLKAYSVINNNSNEEDLENLQYDVDGWHFTEGLKALAHLVNNYPAFYSNLVLTTNFDPLIEIAIASGYGSATSTILDEDGSWRYAFGRATNVVHLHGNWIYSNTLHSSSNLKKSRPLLKNTIKKYLHNCTLLIMGYGGWDDIMMAALTEIASDESTSINIFWCFYSSDEHRLLEDNEKIFDNFKSFEASKGVVYFKGVDLHKSLVAIKDAFKLIEPGKEAMSYLTLSLRLLDDKIKRGAAIKKSGLVSEYIGEMTNELAKYDRRYSMIAALYSVKFVGETLDCYHTKETRMIQEQIEVLVSNIDKTDIHITARPLKYVAATSERHRAFYQSYIYLEEAHDEFIRNLAASNQEAHPSHVLCAKSVWAAHRAMNSNEPIILKIIKDGLQKFIHEAHD